MSLSIVSKLSTAEGVGPIRTAFGRGVTVFDTAEVCRAFMNGEVVGEASQPVHEQVGIVTMMDPTKVSRGYGFRDVYGGRLSRA